MLNTSDHQWHELQHAIAVIAEDKYIFDINGAYKKLCDFNLDADKPLVLYARREEKTADIEFIVLKKAEEGAA